MTVGQTVYEYLPKKIPTAFSQSTLPDSRKDSLPVRWMDAAARRRTRDDPMQRSAVEIIDYD